ncbi:MAG: xylulose kinase [Ardenticatenaceae bacterium]|nr:FGGY-family carbohydrate kinase [Anaerolineales bacterium]MCB8922219.1 xylulose kinase [Ardenticatenaceae bacterium]
MENAGKYILAIDLGTSGPKVVLATPMGRIVGASVTETPVIFLPDGGVEQDPEAWWQAVVQGTRQVLAETAVSPQQIAAISCTAQWSGTVAVDAAGKPLMNAIIWMDTRGEPYVKQITDGLIRVSGYGVHKIVPWLRLTGGMPTHAGKDPIAHILYIQDKHPDIFAATHKFLEPKDYLNLRLAGRFAASYDSIILHWLTDNRDINRITYSDKLLRMAGLPREKFPDLRPAVDILGPLHPAAAADLGLSTDVQVVMGTPDLHSAALGSGAVQDYAGHIYIGTSCWITCHVPFKKTDIFTNIASLPSPIPGRYFVADEQEVGGAALAFLQKNLFFAQDALLQTAVPPNIYPLMDEIAAGVPAGSDGLIFTPWLVGERTPVEDHLVRGGFYNLQLQHTRAHLVRAALEGVALNARWLLGAVERFVKRPFPHLNFIGGGAQSALWSQILADVLNRPIRQMVDPIQANARGAAILAGVALGYTTFDAVAEQVAVTQEYQPNPANRAIYNEMYAAFRDIYKRNRSIYARLNT